MSKHTPGPWEPETAGKGSWIKGSDGNWAALACGTDDANANANGRLIAAAPDLLEVVKAFVVETVDYATLNKLGDPEKQHNVKWARSVIAKAEGRS